MRATWHTLHILKCDRCARRKTVRQEWFGGIPKSALLCKCGGTFQRQQG